MRLLHAICLFFLASTLALCQVPDSAKSTDSEKGTATVVGQVLRLDTGEPLKKAEVGLVCHNGGGFSAFHLADEQGHFAFENVPPGGYDLSVSRNGFVDAEYGQKRPGARGAVLTLSPGQHVTDLVFKLSRAGTISGRVLDEDGEPIAHAEVIAYRAGHQSGKEERTSYDPISTNDLGEFRVFDLPPGRYFIAVNYRIESRAGSWRDAEHEGFNPGYLPTYYPNTTDPAKAAPLTVGPGDEIRSIDFMLRPGRLVTVSGRVINTVPAPSHVNGYLNLTPRGSGLANAARDLGDNFDLKEGRFVIHNVPPGSYLLIAAWSDRESREWHRAQRQLEVGNADLDNVTVTITRGANISGRVTWEGSPAGDPQDVFIRLAPAEENEMFVPPASLQPDGSFILKGVAEGSYRPIAGVRDAEGTFFLKSARYGPALVPDSGFSVQPGSDSALELTISTRAAKLSGTVLTSESLPASGCTVVLIPEGPHRNWKDRYKTASTDQNGRFSIKGITPGDYKLFSWDSDQADPLEPEWYDATWLKPYETKGESIHLEESDNKSINLTLIEAKPDSPASN